MRIGIDARLYKQTGVGRFLKNLLIELQELDTKNEYIIYFRKQDLDVINLYKKNFKAKILDFKWHTFKEQLLVPKILKKDKIDLMHFPYFNVPVLFQGKYLLTVHDLIIDHFNTGKASFLPLPLYKIKRIGYKFAVYLGLKKSKEITSISETTKKEILDHYPVKEEKIMVCYDALDTKFKEIAYKRKPKRRFNFNYILYVGNAYPHKNLEMLLKAFKIVISKKNKFKLVLVGDDQFFYPRLKEGVIKMGLHEKVVFFGNANDEDLIDLYSYSKCLVFPSLMEGFGLPNFEAIECGCLPVVSDIKVFREIWNDNLIYFDQYDTNDMVNKLLQVIDMPQNKYNNYIQKAKKISEKYNWRKTAEQILGLYNKILAE